MKMSTLILAAIVIATAWYLLQRDEFEIMGTGYAIPHLIEHKLDVTHGRILARKMIDHYFKRFADNMRIEDIDMGVRLTVFDSIGGYHIHFENDIDCRNNFPGLIGQSFSAKTIGRRRVDAFWGGVAFFREVEVRSKTLNDMYETMLRVMLNAETFGGITEVCLVLPHRSHTTQVPDSQQMSARYSVVGMRLSGTFYAPL